MRSLIRGTIDFVVGDDVWVAVAVVVLLATTAGLVRLGEAGWWALPLGVPVALWISLRRASRRATA